MKNNLLFVFIWILAVPVFAQDHLSAYISVGLNNNLVLKDKSISLEQSLLSLKNAKSYFLPSVTFITDYLSAVGGRIITFPAGDLLNSVYSTLNQLTSTHNFPPLRNLYSQLLPHTFSDSRFHISYPLLNRDIYYNREISRHDVVMKEYEVDIYRQELIRDIKQAYFNYCTAMERVSIYSNAFILVNLNLTGTQSVLTY